MDKSIRKTQSFLKRQPSITRIKDEVKELFGDGNLNASTMETNLTKTKVILSIPLQFPDESFPAVNPAQTSMSLVSP